MENQVGNLGVRQVRFVRQQTTAQCLVTDVVQIQTLTIVREMDHNFITFLTDFYAQFAGFILACRLALFV